MFQALIFEDLVRTRGAKQGLLSTRWPFEAFKWNNDSPITGQALEEILPPQAIRMKDPFKGVIVFWLCIWACQCCRDKDSGDKDYFNILVNIYTIKYLYCIFIVHIFLANKYIAIHLCTKINYSYTFIIKKCFIQIIENSWIKHSSGVFIFRKWKMEN